MICTVDFETEKIAPRPAYPPEPVGVAIKRGAGEPVYLAWGHPSGNNTTREEAVGALRKVWDDPRAKILMHNAPFDLAVAYERLHLPVLPWHRVHDTMFLLFLHDPHSKSLGLKPASEDLLGWAADEQDELHDWVWNNRAALIAEYGGKITRAKTGENSPGAWISKAPGELVGRYAMGDVARTKALFDYLYPRICRAGMEAAYDRERRLMPLLMENERMGLRVDMGLLEHDVAQYGRALESVEDSMRAYLQSPGLSFDNDRDVASVFEARGVVREGQWILTEKSQELSVSKVNLPPESFVDPLLASAFGYRNRLVTCLRMFMHPWLEQASVNNGYIHTSWNQVRGSRGGARTGRPSMTRPNLLNVSKSFTGRSDGYEHPAQLDLPELPSVRKYVLPDPGHLFLHRDFKQQEVRIFAHFESGDLAQAYKQDPALNPHKWLAGEIERTTGNQLEHTRVKNVTFARLYGGGAGAVQMQARCASLTEARQIIAFHDQALPGRKILSDEIQRIVRRGEPIRTWGGRLYHVEPPSVDKDTGRKQSWEYKMINYLIQGSAADATKEALCRWYYGGMGGHTPSARFLLTVYDEINISAPRESASAHMEYLRQVMEGLEMGVPMLSDGKMGECWGQLEGVE
jgi:DNA polymerase I-like protein with 3'-5' exonuclease and polymerase domains